MKQILGMCCLCIGFAANAVELPALPSAQKPFLSQRIPLQ